jgi:predicted DCC family thiol-disulfide oxidoreductase YuxK
VLILYDADCGLCRVSVALLLRWDRHRSFEAVALQSDRAVLLLPDMSDAERMASFHAVVADGGVLSGSDAVPTVLSALPGAGVLEHAARRMPRTTARAYGAVVTHRSRIGPLIPRRVRRWAEHELKHA